MTDEINNAPLGEKTSVVGTDTVPLGDDHYAQLATIADYMRTVVQILTGKSIDLASNTLTGTLAQFNAALSGADFVSLAGSEVLTNKTLTAPTIADFTNAAHDHGDADDAGAVVAASDTVAGVIELATDAETITGTATNRALTPANLQAMTGSDTRDGILELATDTEALTGTDTARAITPANLRAVLATIPSGTMFNLKLSVTVVSSDLVVAFKTHAGADPSSTDPGYVKIGDTIRSVTAASALTLADATNWFNAGAAETAAKEIDYFAYAVWDSDSNVVRPSCARIPWGRLVSDFSATTTNEKYLGGYSSFTTTDDVCVIGRFAATLSAAAGHVWTVPTFTTINLIQHPIYETRTLDWTPTHDRVTTPYTNQPTVSNAHYHIFGIKALYYERHTQHGTPGGTGNQRFTLPFTNPFANSQNVQAGNSSALTIFWAVWVASSNQVQVIKYDGTAEATASQVYVTEGVMFLK